MKQRLVTQFRALADSTRLMLLGVLLDEELTVGELAEVTEVGQSSVSRHLSALREAGLVVARKQGAMTFYRCRGEDQLLQGDIREQVASLGRQQDIAQRVDRVLERRRQRAKAFFDGAADSWDELRGRLLNESAMLSALVALIPSGLSVVDIGTGTGAMLPHLAQFAHEIVGVDLADGMLQLARQRTERLGLSNVSFQKADLEHLPFEQGRFDAAFAVLALHHAVRPARAVREMARVVRPGGHVIVLDLCAHGHEWLRLQQADLWLGFMQNDVQGFFEGASLADIRFKVVSKVQQQDGKRLELFVASGHKPSRA